jgi:hypothetical protein
MRKLSMCSALLFVLLGSYAHAQVSVMNMGTMENTVGLHSSGTSIEPRTTSESSPVFHHSFGNWTLMLHANAFIQDIQQSGPRGADKFVSTNWFMPMLSRQSGRSTISLRTMISLEPATVSQRRYPELLQTGETAYGLPIVDGQHPHNLVMELAGRYEFSANDKTNVFVYGGPVGDPALGPPAFAHRASASENPMAVLGHHEQDSTHTSISVATVGMVHGPLQIEASTFHGREPNENRWTIARGAPDSFSTRITASPFRSVTGQFSVGRINNREALEPGLDTVRMTASVHHDLEFSSGHLSSSLIWGRNKDLAGSESRIFNAYTFESTANFAKRNWAWTRIENVDKDRTLFDVRAEEEPAARIQAYTFGYERDVYANTKVNVGVGAQFTAYGTPAALKAIYGDHPSSVVMFLRIRPVGNMAAHMRIMHR